MRMKMDATTERQGRRIVAGRAEIADRIAVALPSDRRAQPQPGVNFAQSSKLTELVHGFYEPAFCVIAQDAKTIPRTAVFSRFHVSRFHVSEHEVAPGHVDSGQPDDDSGLGAEDAAPKDPWAGHACQFGPFGVGETAFRPNQQNDAMGRLCLGGRCVATVVKEQPHISGRESR
jgi:hypothetical protein